MPLLTTVEVRWFIEAEGARADAARAWFAAVPVEGRREDRYLVTTRDDVGIKARLEGDHPARLETKILVASLGAVPVAGRFVGVLERWQKLSVEMASAIDDDAAWLRVKKARRRRAHGDCGVELTELTYDGGRALTVGAETTGSEQSLREACEAVLASAPAALQLGERESSSYPKWVCRVAGAR